ncbi:MAG TPA: terminase family protein [Rhizomicrobium sp.]
MNAASINSLPPNARQAFLTSLNSGEAEFLNRDWRFWARRSQVPPGGDWRIWLFLGGRGSGKTRAGAEWIAEGVARGEYSRVALIGATHNDARQVMIEGESGLLRVAPTTRYEPSNNRVLWPSGAIATVLSAEEPDSIRGHQFDAGWGDEFAKWNSAQSALDMLLMSLRLGKNPRLALTSTPRNIAALKNLLEDGSIARTQSSTGENKANLAPGFLALMESRYGGTRLGRQELEAELIEDNESALWRRDWIERARTPAAPQSLARVVIGVDPPASLTGDECGIVVAGRAESEAGFVLADLSAGGLSPNAWAARVADAFEHWHADAIIAEANQGGEMVRSVLQQAAPNLAVQLVHARRGKITRAAPMAALYEQGRIHHIGCFPEMEDQMCQYDGTGESPDRMDALVWALTDLFGTKRAAPRVRKL